VNNACVWGGEPKPLLAATIGIKAKQTQPKLFLPQAPNFLHFDSSSEKKSRLDPKKF
jgi:hypothetical protein